MGVTPANGRGKALITQQSLDRMVFFDIKSAVCSVAPKLMFGSGYKLQSDNKQIDDFLKDFEKRNKLGILFQNNEFNLAYWGRTVITINFTKTGRLYLNLENPGLYNRVASMYYTELIAKTSKVVSYGDLKFTVESLWTPTQVKKTIWFEGEQLSMDGYNEQVPEDLQEVEVWKHNMGIVPLVEFTNKPATLFNHTSSQDTMQYLADDWKVRDLPVLINQSLKTRFKVMLYDAPRLVGRFSDKQKRDIVNSGTALASFLSDFILQSSVVPKGKDGGVSAPMEYIGGKFEGLPNLSQETKDLIELYYVGCELTPPLTDEVPQTEDEVLFKAGADINTTTQKRVLRQSQISHLIDKVLVAGGLMTLEQMEDTEREYSFEINENLVINEAGLTETIILQLTNGLIGTAEAIAKLRNIPLAEAEEIAKKVQEEQLEETRLYTDVPQIDAKPKDAQDAQAIIEGTQVKTPGEADTTTPPPADDDTDD